MAERASISACLIVRNEAELLAECLASIRRAVDDIVVVDTGSTDASPQIASEAGGRVFRFQWNDHFAEARNYALDHAAGQWILSIDADERLDENSASTVRALSRRKDAGAFLVKIRSPLRSPAGPETVHMGSYPRFFRRLPQVRFEGRIHEQLLPSLSRAGILALDSDILIHHLGYAASEQTRRAKHSRNLRLLRQQIAEEPDNAFAMYCLASLHDMMGEDELCVQWCQRSLAVCSTEPKVHFLLGIKLLKLRRPAEAAGPLRKAIDLAPHVPESHYNLAAAAVRLGDYASAAQALAAYVRLRPADPRGKRLLASALLRAQALGSTA